MRKLKNSELNRLSIQEFKKKEKLPIIIILDNIRSLHNVGSVFRTSDAFLIEKIYLCGITATPPHKEIQKTALGATESVEWEYIENVLDVIQQLKKDQYQIISIEQTEKSTMLHNFITDNSASYALIFGNEVNGVQQEVVSNSDTIIEIPQFGTKHSLNIAVSTGIVIWNFVKQLS
ncbi:MAG: RNA methyltransferase [Flavobacteriales bacterium]